MADDVALNSREWIVKVAALVAPLVRTAVAANADDVAASKQILEEYVVPVGRILGIIGGIVGNTVAGDSFLESPRAELKKQERRIARVLGHLDKCRIDDGHQLLQAAVTVFIHEAFPRIPQLLLDDISGIVVAANAQKGRLAKSWGVSVEALLDDAENASPDSARKALAGFDRLQHAKDFALSMTLFRKVAASTGEARAEAVVHACRRISETIYRPYVTRLYLLWGATRQRAYGEADYGAMVRSLADQGFPGVYPNLLDADAVLLRNAAAHDSWDYDDATDSVVVSDRSKPTRAIPVDEVIQKCASMLEVAGVAFPKLVDARRLAPLAGWMTEVEHIWKRLVDADPTTRKVAFKLFREWVESKAAAAKPLRPRRTSAGRHGPV